ncbi:tRNA preQ1(34) S-adenosylmethionine ribosyltransferase-isomerase QueA [candidate division WOR-3 bacterium]|nr:tRNA preQ1(34) S-adenosylmethionine ribosyltransferase-isomerase QueA [candidate division WOR-3 bacterium]
MKLQEFNYTLPKELIAQHALEDRAQARLLILDRSSDAIIHTTFERIIDHLCPEDVMIINNTKVFKARLIAHKKTGGRVDILLTAIKKPDQATAMISHAKRTMIDTVLQISDTHNALIAEKHGSLCTLTFNKPVEEIIEIHGIVPLPHYIRRPAIPEDEHDYQTVFAQKTGSIAAPTAGLHFTDDIMRKLRQKGILIRKITLHIGPGTFKPIRAEHVEDHMMDAEYYEIPESTMQTIKNAKRIIGVGTSVCRALETYALTNECNGMADLFIRPGHEFKTIDALITNFHMPCSTPLVLVSALAGKDRILNAYEEAKKEKYCFLSYGDAMFIT